MADIPLFWRKRTVLSYVLRPLSWVFRLVVAYRRWQTVAVAARVPVVVVGNITVGGNGKTPVVIALVKALQARGLAVAVVSRGTGGAVRAAALVSASCLASEVGDEPLLIAREANVPVAVGRERSQAVALLLREYPNLDVIVSDDGLQHYRMARRVELAVIAPDLMLGNGFCLPAGALREPPSRLDTVDAVLYTGAVAAPVATTSPSFVLTMQNDGFVNIAGEAVATPIECVVLTAIARPERFLHRLAGLGVQPLAVRTLPDHAPLSEQEAAFANGKPIVMTAKDAVKTANWSPAARARVVVLNYAAILPEELMTLIMRRLK